MANQLLVRTLTSLLAVALLDGAVSAEAEEKICRYSRVIPDFSRHDFWPHSSTVVPEIHSLLESSATLFRRGSNGRVVYELAKEIEINNKEGLMTVHLDQSCHWSDGSPISAQDILAGIKLNFSERALKAYIPGRSTLNNGHEITAGTAALSEIGVRAIDNATLEFDLIVPARILQLTLSYVTFTPAPLHLMETDPGLWPNPSLVRVSSGPFRAVSETGDQIIFKRNPHYCTGFQGNIDEIILHGRDGRRGSVLMLLGGQSDIAEQVTATQISALKIDDKELVVEESREEIMAYFKISMSNPQLAQKETRRALLLAIDRERLRGAISGGAEHSRIMNSISFDYEGYEPASLHADFFKPLAVRRKMAREIMEKLGYSRQNPLKLTFGVSVSQPYQQIGNAISSMLNGIHVQAEPRPSRIPTERGKMDLTVNAWGADVSDPGNILSGVTQDFMSAEHSLKVAKANSVLEEQERYEALREYSQSVLDSFHFLPLVELRARWIYSTDITFLNENYPIGRNVLRSSCL